MRTSTPTTAGRPVPTNEGPMRRCIALVTSAIVLAGVAGCAGAPPVLSGPKLPPAAAGFAQAPAGAGTAEPAERFWRAFGDADLDGLVTDALAANADIRLAVARLREARALERLAGADDLPRVGTSASAARVRAPDRNGNTGSGNAFGAGVDIRWEADLFGRNDDEQTAATADSAASAALVQAARLAVAGDVARSYFELRGLQERLRVARESLETQREALKLVVGRLEAGRGTALDTERARALVLGTEAIIPALELQIVLVGQRLAVLLGQVPKAVDARVVAPKPLPGLQAVALGGLGSPENLLRRRPDLQAAEQQAVAAAARVGVAYKARLPSLTLGGTLGLNAGRLADLTKGASFLYNLGASLAWTLFDNGAQAALTDAAQARQLAAVIAYERAVLLALEETEGALATYTRTQQQAQSLFGAAEAADKAAEIARGRFGAGVSDFLAVLDAERERLAARDRLATAQTAAAVSIVSVYKALAGGVGDQPGESFRN
jgi:outer membrane protein, multidrug efflux system